MSEPKDNMTKKTLSLNVRLKPSEPSAHPWATNYTNVGVAQGIAYLNFGFIEPTLLAAIAKTAKNGRPRPKDWTAPLSLAWQWAWMCSHDCINRFKKCWWGWALDRNQRRRV